MDDRTYYEQRAEAAAEGWPEGHTQTVRSDDSE